MKILGGKFKGRTLKTPTGSKTRPTSSKIKESIFNMLQNQIEGATFLDLFAGSGSMGIEALSRGALEATFVENDPIAMKLLRENLKTLGLSGRLIQASVFTTIPRFIKKREVFDIIYMDPPYALDLTFLLDSLPPLLVPEGTMLIEQRKGVEINLPTLANSSLRVFGDTAIHVFKKNV